MTTLTVQAQYAQRCLDMIGRWEQRISAAAFLVLTAVLAADVFSRELTGTGLVWARQVGVYANLLLTLAGLGIASAAGAHLRPRFADGWLPIRFHHTAARLQECVMAGACALFALLGVLATHETFTLAERTSLPDWPVWPFQVVIPLVFAVAALRHGCFALWPALRPAEAGDEAAQHPQGQH